MKDEIKEILELFGGTDENIMFGDIVELNSKQSHLLLDYITILQQKEELLRQEIKDVRKAFNGLQQENERLEEKNKYIFSKVNDDELLISNAMNYTEAQDYKSRCENATVILNNIYLLDNVSITNNAVEEIDKAINILQGVGKYE